VWALDSWAANPRLGFVDALSAAYGQAPNVRLATFNTDCDNLPGVDRWQFGELA
jgi:hypothetical protein